jgi:hypothetical protein
MTVLRFTNGDHLRAGQWGRGVGCLPRKSRRVSRHPH